jgi:hypothetical protein
MHPLDCLRGKLLMCCLLLLGLWVPPCISQVISADRLPLKIITINPAGLKTAQKTVRVQGTEPVQVSTPAPSCGACIHDNLGQDQEASHVKRHPDRFA